MRHLTTSAGLLLLQAPVLTQGLPLPHKLRGDADKPVAGDKQTPILPSSPPPTPTPTTTFITTPTPVLESKPVSTRTTITTVTTSTSSSLPSSQPNANNNNNDHLDGDLTQELAELATLRLQLAALAREVREREAWLARQSSAVETTADCDGLGCVGRVFLRRVRHVVRVVGSGGGHGHDVGGTGGRSVPVEEPAASGKGIPRPPWRGGAGLGVDESAAGYGAGAEQDAEGGFDPFLIGLSAAVLMSVVALLATGGYSSCVDAGRISSLCSCVGCRQRRSLPRVEAEQAFWERMDFGEQGLEPWPRYTDSDEPRYTDGDEKRQIEVEDEVQSDEEEDMISWNEKRAEQWQTEEAMTSSDESHEEPQTEEATVPIEEPESETEESTMAEEIMAFRSAVDLVEALIAGEEARMASRRRPPF
ncbi:hypothetical protein VTJ49DRAFT_4626 [Mycothermus thermophilus]|uniref:Transmembrane protein n=1 Tax=Humicola insolens TaxID=85995 RepID=A0ABR3V4Z0_HUMIN